MVTSAQKKKKMLSTTAKNSLIIKDSWSRILIKGVIPYSTVIPAVFFLLNFRYAGWYYSNTIYYSNHSTLFPQGASWLGPIQTSTRSQNVLMVLAPDTCHIDMYHRTKPANNKKALKTSVVPYSIPVQDPWLRYINQKSAWGKTKQIPGGTGI